MKKKIIITGATGFVGQHLVRRLIEGNFDLILVGRSVRVVQSIFPKIKACSYNNLEKASVGTDTIIHLAVANNDQKLSDDDFVKANVDILVDILNIASKNSVGNIINLSTFHAFSENDNGYVHSKKLALMALQNYNELQIVNIFCPAIYGKKFKGKLGLINHFPGFFRKTVLTFVSAFQPVVNIEKVLNQIVSEVEMPTKHSHDLYVADEITQSFAYTVFKKLVDLGFVLFVLILFWWLLIFAWIGVKLSSSGPGVFSQTRVGLNGDDFTCYKFRTMYAKTANVGTHEVAESSITWFGKFLRKTKIDELPQVINLLKNEMSLVGPRPGLPSQKDLYDFRQARGVLAVKPGITGYAQINDINMSEPKKLAEWDQRYIAMRSIRFELSILLKTLIGRGHGKNIKDPKSRG